MVRPATQLRSHLDGTVFADHLAGDGGLVLALHGWGRDRTDLAEVVSGRRATCVDLPGFGSSPPPPEPWGAADYAAAMARLLDEASESNVLVLGHSFGGRVAVCLAAARPDLVRGVVLAGVPLMRLGAAPKPSRWFRFVRWANRAHLVPDGTMERLRRARGSTDYNAAVGVMRQVLVKVVGETYEEQLSALDAPVGFCWGELDSAAPPEVARRAAELVRRCAALEVVPGAGHDVHRDSPGALRSVLDRTEEASGS